MSQTKRVDFYDAVSTPDRDPIGDLTGALDSASPCDLLDYAARMESLFTQLGDARAKVGEPCSFDAGHTWAEVLDAVRAGVKLGGGPNERAILPAFDVVPCQPNGHALALRGVAAGKLMVGHWRVTIAGADYVCNTNEAMAVAAVLAGHTNVSALGFIIMDAIPTDAAATFVLENVKPHDKQDPNDLQVNAMGEFEIADHQAALAAIKKHVIGGPRYGGNG